MEGTFHHATKNSKGAVPSPPEAHFFALRQEPCHAKLHNPAKADRNDRSPSPPIARGNQTERSTSPCGIPADRPLGVDRKLCLPGWVAGVERSEPPENSDLWGRVAICGVASLHHSHPESRFQTKPRWPKVWRLRLPDLRFRLLGRQLYKRIGGDGQ